MFRNKIKEYIKSLYREAVEEAKLDLKAEEKVFEAEKPTARDVVGQIFDNGITWFDWNEGTKDERRGFYHDAQYILNSEIFNNVINYLVATGSQAATLQQSPDSGAIRDFQMTVNGMKLLKEELESIYDPNKQNFIDL